MLRGLSTSADESARLAKMIGEKILDNLNQPYLLNNAPYRSTPSIGVTLFQGTSVGSDELLKQADLAMYESKAAGRNTQHFFDPSMGAALQERAALESDLAQAIESEQFILYYQVQVDDGLAKGAEALLRWCHPTRGTVSPAEFIPLAEETGLILPLGNWVLDTACRQLARWAYQPGMEHLLLAVNVSAQQFRQADFVERVRAAIKLSGANPRRLKLELTESMMVNDVKKTIDKMLALKAGGVTFALDDFGTGYSSLSYLKQLPLAQLKIDRSFINDVLDDNNAAVITCSIVALGKSLGLEVIAEGVENNAQREFLLRNGCSLCQGFHFGRPQPIDIFETSIQVLTPVS
jgi:EAL domain-containing protein (putative c-di-GMP-specific phosphodiesterase class I)